MIMVLLSRMIRGLRMLVSWKSETCLLFKTERLILRAFRQEDVDTMAELFANPDFMRFSLGVYTERKQTVAFIAKVIGWDLREYAVAVCHGLARTRRAYWLLRFFFIILKFWERSRSGTDCIPTTVIAALSLKPRALCAIPSFAI